MDDPTFIAVSGKGSFKNLEDLISASKKKALNWGVAQIGGTEHIGLAQFAKEAGIKFKVVPFGSGAQSKTVRAFKISLKATVRVAPSSKRMVAELSSLDSKTPPKRRSPSTPG